MLPWIVALIAVAAVVAALASRPAKRFGLKEAQAALRYVRSEHTEQAQVSARTVMAVVVGVLGYQNAVADDVQTETAQLTETTTKRGSEIADNEKTIEELRAEIERLRSENLSAEERAANLREIAEIFRG